MERQTPTNNDKPTSESSPKPDENVDIEELAEGVSGTEIKSPEILDVSLDDLKLSLDYLEKNTSTSVVTGIPVRKPKSTEYFRVRPGEDFRTTSMGFRYGHQNDFYLVASRAIAPISEILFPLKIVLCVSTEDAPFLWPLRLPTPDNDMQWFRSALMASEIAEGEWVKISANMGIGAYDLYTTESITKEPRFPDTDFAELVKLGFQGKIITSPDNQMVVELSGKKYAGPLV